MTSFISEDLHLDFKDLKGKASLIQPDTLPHIDLKKQKSKAYSYSFFPNTHIPSIILYDKLRHTTGSRKLLPVTFTMHALSIIIPYM